MTLGSKEAGVECGCKAGEEVYGVIFILLYCVPTCYKDGKKKSLLSFFLKQIFKCLKSQLSQTYQLYLDIQYLSDLLINKEGLCFLIFLTRHTWMLFSSYHTLMLLFTFVYNQ